MPGQNDEAMGWGRGAEEKKFIGQHEESFVIFGYQYLFFLGGLQVK